MPNSSILDRAIKNITPGIKTAIHINLSEGCVCAQQDKVSLLQRDGHFFRGYISLLLLSIIRKKEFEEQVYAEICAQIKAVTRNMPSDYKIRVDGHVHVHMIPGVFLAICRALRDSGHEVEHIRFSAETISIYLKTPQIWKFILPINIVKTLITKFFSLIDKRILKQYGYEDKIGLFYGLGFAGKMHGEHVRIILDKYIEHAHREHKSLEVLFHPGGIQNGESFLSSCPDSYKKYYTSDDRIQEAKMLKRLYDIGY